MGIFGTLWHKFVTVVGGDLQAAETFAGPFISQMVSANYVSLAGAVLDAVVAAETTGGTGAAKFAAAKNVFVSDITSKGLPVVENLVNAMLETAVSHLKAAATPAPVAVAPAAPVASDVTA